MTMLCFLLCWLGFTLVAWLLLYIFFPGLVEDNCDDHRQSILENVR
jgi:hypothetical protein